AQSGGVARMYKHQHELLEELDKHYTIVNKAVETEAKPPLPLHVILSTPTGSGKTFTALMVHLRLLKVKHPNVILVYSVPTKQVLKRVGQECEAHAAPYWTAARDHSGDGTLHQVRRPYSIRDKARNRKALRAKAAIGEKLSAGSGNIEQQLEYAADEDALTTAVRKRRVCLPCSLIALISSSTAWAQREASIQSVSRCHQAQAQRQMGSTHLGQRDR
ncbi:DEAD/DEAH box helicase family protein, partial [Candidatus Dependentiae bacterium]|nr:DEAD/DEAH box helicase family protein [Candidatus Dependentiae bacterium]